MESSLDAQYIIGKLHPLDINTKLEQGLQLIENNLTSPKIDELKKLAVYLLDISREVKEYQKYFDVTVLLTARLIKSGSLDDAKNKLDDALKFADGYDGDDKKVFNGISHIYNNLGGYYGTLGNIQNARVNFTKALEGFQKLQNEAKIASTQINIAALYIMEGEVNEALHRLMSVYDYYAKLDDNAVLGNYFKNLGLVYNFKGEFNKALEFYHKSLDHKQKTGDKLEISTTLHSIAEIYTSKGEYDKAESLLQQSLELKMEFNANSIKVVESLFELLKICVLKENNDKTKEILSQIEKIAEKNRDVEYVELYNRVAKAYVKRSSNRISDHAEAQRIFKDIIKEDRKHYLLTTFSIVNLCELLLMELKNNYSQDILDEIDQLLDRLYTYSISQKSDYMTIETLLIKAQVSLYSGNFEKYEILLEEASQLAEEKQIQILLKKIQEMKAKFAMNIIYWKEILLKKEDEIANMDYLEIVQYLRDVKINYNIFMK